MPGTRSLASYGSLVAILWSLFLLLPGPASARDDERVGQVSQPLVQGAPVAEAFREQYGLVTLDTGCSGSLLTNTLVLTAAHCIDRPDPAAAGAFLTMAPASLSVFASWGASQSIQATQIWSYRPLDVAVVRVGGRFTVLGKTDGFKQQLCCGDRYPEWDHFPIEVLGRGIDAFASGSGASATPSRSDGQYRYGRAQISQLDTDRYWYQSTDDGRIAGGDSGGPSFRTLRTGRAITGVHSLCMTRCLEGKICGPWPGPGPAPAGYSRWEWVAGTSRCADAPVEPVWDQIVRLVKAEPAVEPPPQFIGTFERNTESPHPIWIYGMRGSGDVIWYRKGSGIESWAGGKRVLAGISPGSRLIAAGRNSFYAVDEQGEVLWLRHESFSQGGPEWKGPLRIGSGWDAYRLLFAGGDGVVYGVRHDGTLYWMKNKAYRDMNAGDPYSWEGPRQVGSGWDVFSHVFAMGGGILYGVRPDGEVFWYKHEGYSTGEPSWTEALNVASGWQGFSHFIPAGDGIILAVRGDGSLYQYRHVDYSTGRSIDSEGTAGPPAAPPDLSSQMTRMGTASSVSGASRAPAARIGGDRMGAASPGTSALAAETASGFAFGKPHWSGPEKVGSGWQWFESVVAILPDDADVPR